MSTKTQTKTLLMCLLPGTDTQTILNRYRVRSLSGLGYIAALPPLIPLWFLTELPSFETSRRCAAAYWKPTASAEMPSMVSDASGRSIVIGVDPFAWRTFRTDAGFALGSLAFSETQPSPIAALGPWILLGQTNMRDAAPVDVSGAGAVPCFSIRKVQLAVLRISSVQDEGMEATRWELMGSWHVPAQ